MEIAPPTDQLPTRTEKGKPQKWTTDQGTSTTVVAKNMKKTGRENLKGVHPLLPDIAPQKPGDDILARKMTKVTGSADGHACNWLL